MKILVIEDDPQMVSFLEKNLEQSGHAITSCNAIEKALKNSYPESHDVIVLDLMLVGKNGQYLVKQLREQRNPVPVLVLSSIDSIETKVKLMNLGADDYMTKPVDVRELEARLNSLHRRYLELAYTEELTVKRFTFFRKHNELQHNGKKITFTKIEAALFEHLFKNNGRVISEYDLIVRVWGNKFGSHSNVLAATVSRLRRKMPEGITIKNNHGIGYRLDVAA